MQTGEIVALTVVIILLLVATLFICYKCAMSIITQIQAEEEYKESHTTDPMTFTNVLRASFRSSIRRIGSLRRRPPPRQPSNPSLPPPVTNVTSISELEHGRSELHPRYLPQKNTVASQYLPHKVGAGCAPYVPPASEGGGGYDNQALETVGAADNPQSLNASTLHDIGSGYDQPVDATYYEDISVRLSAAIPDTKEAQKEQQNTSNSFPSSDKQLEHPSAPPDSHVVNSYSNGDGQGYSSPKLSSPTTNFTRDNYLPANQNKDCIQPPTNQRDTSIPTSRNNSSPVYEGNSHYQDMEEEVESEVHSETYI